MADILGVYLGSVFVGQLTLLPGDHSFFVFDENYVNDQGRPVLSQSFFTESSDLILETQTTRTKLPPFFSNLLPKGQL